MLCHGKRYLTAANYRHVKLVSFCRDLMKQAESIVVDYEGLFYIERLGFITESINRLLWIGW